MIVRAEPFEKRFLELYSVVADAPTLEDALARLERYTVDRLGAAKVRAVADQDPPRPSDDTLSLAEPGAESPWLHLAISWGRRRRTDDAALRSFRGSLAMLMPFLAQRRRLDRAAQHLGDPSVGRLASPDASLEEPELKRLLKRLVERAVQEASGTHGAILLLQPATDELKLEASAYVGPLVLDPGTLPRVLRRRHTTILRKHDAERRRNPSTSGLFFRVLDTRRPYRSGSVLDDPHYLPLFRGSRSNLTVPLLLGGTAVGTLLVESNDRDAFTSAHEERLRHFAETAAALIAKARVYEETRAAGPEHTLRLFGLSAEILSRAHQAAALRRPVLLRGEPGTGKEMLARYIHRTGDRRDGPFVVAADSATLRDGDASRAAGGTLFVPEIDRLPQTGQESLAAVLESGGDVRVIASSCGGTLAPALAGAFETEIVLPPLRLRPDAIAPLARLILRETCEGRGVPVKLLAAPALEALLRYPFPGNLDEMREIIETAAAAADGPVLQPFHLPPQVLGRRETARTYRAMQEQTELAYLSELLTRTHGELAEASRLSGLERPQLQRLLKKHSLTAADFAAR